MSVLDRQVENEEEVSCYTEEPLTVLCLQPRWASR